MKLSLLIKTENPSASCRILTCELTIRNPLRVEEVFGHSHTGIFEVLEGEIRRVLPTASTQKRKFASLFRRWTNADGSLRAA